MEKLKRVYVKEELVCITGDFIKAIILDRFLYWGERIKDIEGYMREEKDQSELHGYNIINDVQDGWFYKTADEISDETMLYLSAPSVRMHITALVENGYVFQRKNPVCKRDKTIQYKVNWNKIKADLAKNGYSLEQVMNQEGF